MQARRLTGAAAANTRATQARSVRVQEASNWLNIAFLILAGALIIRFARTGGGMMLKMMGGAPEPAGAGGGHARHGVHGMDAVDAGGRDEGHAHPGRAT